MFTVTKSEEEYLVPLQYRMKDKYLAKILKKTFFTEFSLEINT